MADAELERVQESGQNMDPVAKGKNRKRCIMSKNILRWFWYLSAVTGLCLIGVTLYPSIVFSDTLYIVCEYAVVEALVLAVVLSILRSLNLFVSWKLIAYHAIVVAGSLAINFLLSPIELTEFVLFALTVFALLVFLNFALSKLIFVISVRKACMIGMLTGLINALMVITSTTFFK